MDLRKKGKAMTFNKTCGLTRGGLILAVAMCSLVLGGGLAQGQWEQTHKLTADDGAEGDQFGTSVSVSGNTIVVGAHIDDDAGAGSGSAYVFDATTGEQLHKLTAEDAAQSDYFGHSVSVSGDTIVVGAHLDDDTVHDSGSAYVFNATTGEQLLKLTAGDAGYQDQFGWSVSVSGNTIVVGAHHDNDAGTDSGSAYVFDATTGEQLLKLTADDGQEQDLFGSSVAISFNIIVIGAHGDDDGGYGSGAAYMFDAITGEQLHKLTAADASEGDLFGNSVSVSGKTIVIGAYRNDDPGTDSGSAYVYDAITGGQLHKLIADVAGYKPFFGCSVSVSGNTIVGGAYCDHYGSGSCGGAAFVFDDPCAADIYKDGIVDVLDLMVVLAKWGTADLAADITGPYGVPDGVVDVQDLLAVLSAWGPCS